MKALSAWLLLMLFLITGHAKETVKALVLKNFPPQYSLDEQGHPTGFAIDMIEEVAKIAHIELEYILVDGWPENNKLFFEQGIGDIVPNSGITPRRLNQAFYTTPMETISIRAFKRTRSTDIHQISDLDHLSVSVVRKNRGESLMEHHPKELLKIYDSRELAFNALVSGEVDAFIFAERPIRAMIHENNLEGAIESFGAPLDEIKRGIRIQKSRPDLAVKLDNALKELLNSPKYLEIYQKWYYQEFKNYRTLKTIKSACKPDYPPFSTGVLGGTANGFAIDLLRAALHNMGKEVNFQVENWSTIKKELSQGQLDALPMMGRTLQREKEFDFSFPFMQIFGALVVREDNHTIHTLQDISDKRLIVLEEGTASAFIHRNQIATHLVPARTYKEAMELLSSAKGDAVLIQKYVGAALLKEPEFHGLHMLPDPIKEFRQDFCFAVKKNNHELLAILNEGLAIARVDGTYERLHRKWFPDYYEKEVDSTLFYFLLGALGVALMALIVVWIWQKTLSQKVKEKTSELEQSNQRWYDMFYKHDGVMLLVDPVQKGKIIEANDAALRYYGYTHDQITQMSIQDINVLSPGEVQQEMERAKRLKRNHFEFKHRLKNGNIRDVEVHSTPIQTPEGSLLFSIINDISDRKEMELEMKNQEQSLRTIVDYAPQGMVIADRSMMVLAYNAMCYELFDLPPSTYRIGRHFSGILKDWVEHTKQTQEMYELALAELHRQEHFEFDFPQTIKGEERWCHLTHTPLPDGGFIRTFTDISNLKKTEVALRESQTLYQSLVDSLPMCVYRTDLEGRVIFINQAMEKYFKTPSSSVIGQSIYDFYPKDLAQKHRTDDSHLIAENQILHSVDENIDSKTGEPSFIETVKIPIHDEQGRTDGIQGIFWDITEQKKMEEDLRKLNENLESRVSEELEKNRQQEQLLIHQSRFAAIGEMIGAIAHQWRQPLTSIGGVLINIQDDYEFGQMTQESLESQIHDGEELLAYMSQTIEDFRNFFRPNKSKKHFDVKAQCFEAFRLLKDQLEYHNVQHNVICCDHGENIVACENVIYSCNGYPNEFKQVVINLISNAKDSICEKKITEGKIILSIDKTDHWVMITVEDNGGGIPEKILEKIFDPYFTTKHESQGTGLGLYMSKTIIEKNMNGTISLANSGHGAKATITLPLSSEEKQYG